MLLAFLIYEYCCFRYGMYGSYRQMLEKPTDFSWRTQQYSNADEDLLQTELDALNKLPPPTTGELLNYI